MKIAIMQPYFFPYLGYFQLIHAVDKFILYDNLTFIKDAWMNRNRIMVKNQQPALISVPLEKKSSNKMIKEICLSSNTSWKSTVLNTIHLNYRKAPFFDEIYPVVEKVVTTDFDTLSSLNAYSIKQISINLSISTAIAEYPAYDKLEENLRRNSFAENYVLNQPERKVVRVLEIVKVENANMFINPIGGQQLYSKKEFAMNNVELYFLRMDDIQYPQFSRSFHSSLSIIDVLMHNGWNGTAELLNKYKLL